MDPAPCWAGWSVPRDPSLSDGTKVSCPWLQEVRPLLQCSKSSFCSTRAPQTLPALGNKGRGEMGWLTWEWDTSWCVVSFPINSNKAKTETWQWFCSRDAAAGCSVLPLLQLVSTEQLLRMSGTPKIIPLCAVSCLWDSATFLISRKQPCQACSKEQEPMVWWPQQLGWVTLILGDLRKYRKSPVHLNMKFRTAIRAVCLATASLSHSCSCSGIIGMFKNQCK